MSSPIIYYLVMHFMALTQHHGYLGWARRLFFIVIKGNPLLRECSKIFCTQGKDLQSIEDHGCRLMVSLFNGTQSD